MRWFTKLSVLALSAGAIFMLLAWTMPEPPPMVGDNDIQAADAAKGKSIFKKKCQECHAVSSKGLKRTGEVDKEAEVQPPDLSKSKAWLQKKDAEYLGKYLKKKKKKKGKKHPKKYKGSDEKVADLIAFLKSI